MRSKKPGRNPRSKAAPAQHKTAALDPAEFRTRLIEWYRESARGLPWRGTADPYRTWISEIMLQQTRVAAVIEHYNEFLRRFPTLFSLALADEADVLAAWSGLGYYRRARMLHKAAQFIVLERDGRLPATAAELRTLPGIGDYTAAAIASIAFGEPVAVVDGNVERVVLRLAGRADESTAAAHAFVREQAQALVPGNDAAQASSEAANGARPQVIAGAGARGRGRRPWDAEERIALAASAHPTERAGGNAEATKPPRRRAGNRNQAMMELGATVCLPREPLCSECPVFAMCRTRGEHATQPRARQRSVPAAYLLDLRKLGTATEVLLELRAGDAQVMPAMFELHPADGCRGRARAVLRVRHSITNTNYYVQVFAPQHFDPTVKTKPEQALMHPLRRAVKKKDRELRWVRTSRLPGIPVDRADTQGPATAACDGERSHGPAGIDVHYAANYFNARNCCSVVDAPSTERASSSLARLCAKSALIRSSSAEVADSCSCTTSTLSVTPASNRWRVRSSVSRVTCRLRSATVIWLVAACRSSHALRTSASTCARWSASSACRWRRAASA